MFPPQLTKAQYPPLVSSASETITIHSPIDHNITIRYKIPPIGTCTTVFPKQQQYTGYISLPRYKIAPVQQNYSINTFFWFIEARTSPSTAPLTIFLNGGPGSSSMVGLFQENGPCEVVEIAEGKLGTQPRDWGWDRSSNILYIDQPNQVGFSYDKLTNGSLDLFTSSVSMPPSTPPSGQPAYTFLNGTFGTGKINSTANTTETAAIVVWHMLQGFLSVFPQYNPGSLNNNTKPGTVGINLFTESYGGKYGPAFAAYWEKQNARRRNGTIPANKTLDVSLSSVGIMQGCVDDLVQGRFYPIFANNNTYGIQAISLIQQQNAASSFVSADGCQQLIQLCRDAVSSMDPDDDGHSVSVNQICSNAKANCEENVVGPYAESGRNIYDISQQMPDPFPSSTYLEYLNSADVQTAIGARVNFTQSSSVVSGSFSQTGDYERGGQISDLAQLLSLGVRVALLYGDRDYVCNWLGGEAVSFSVAAQLSTYMPFYSAGYADIVVNDSYVGGAVRQFGNLSFSRIYDAGHLIPAYQPETAFTVFTRIIMGTEISTGEPVDLATFASAGDANATFTNTAPDQADPTCWVRNIQGTCSGDQTDMLRNGHGVIINGILYEDESDWKAPASSVFVDAGFPGTLPISMTATPTSSVINSGSPTTTDEVLTGVFVATTTPSETRKGAASSTLKVDLILVLILLLIIGLVQFVY